MAVKFELDKKKDQLVPYAALDAFANGIRIKLTTPSSFETLFTKEDKREEKKKRMENLVTLIEGLPKKQGRYWFVDLFLAANDGKADDLAKEIFKDLTKGYAFKELEKAVSEYNKNFKAKALAVAQAAQALTIVVAEKMTPAAGEFGKEFKENLLTPPAPAPGGSPPTGAPTSESIDRELYRSKKLLELGFISENEYLAKLVEIRNILKNVLLEQQVSLPSVEQIKAARARSPDEAARRAAGGDAGAASAVAPTPGTATPTPGTATPTPGTATPTPGTATPTGAPADSAATQAIQAIASAISTIAGKVPNDENSELVKLTQKSGATQQAFIDMEKGVIAESLTSKQKQLVKLQVKKQVLAEYVKTGETTTKAQLNEFFLTALIFAALAGVIAWATSKLWPVLKGAVNGYEPSYRSRQVDPVKSTQSLVQALGGGYNSQGQLVDINGKAVTDIKTQTVQFKTDLQSINDAITKAASDIITTTDTNVKALQTFAPFQQTFRASPTTQVNAVIAALTEVENL